MANFSVNRSSATKRGLCVTVYCAPLGPNSFQNARPSLTDIATESSKVRSLGCCGGPCRNNCAELATSRPNDSPKCLTTRLPLSSKDERTERKSVVSGKRMSVLVDLGARSNIKQKKQQNQ